MALQRFSIPLGHNACAVLTIDEGYRGPTLRILQGEGADEGAYYPPKDVEINGEVVNSLFSLLAENLPIGPAEIDYMGRALQQLTQWGCKVEVTLPRIISGEVLTPEEDEKRKKYTLDLLGKGGAFNVAVYSNGGVHSIQGEPIGGYVNPFTGKEQA